MKTHGRGFGRAKTILLGEHAVVHGQPALAAALDVGVRASAFPHEGPLVKVAPWGVEVRPEPESTDDLARALGRLVDRAPPDVRDARVEAECEVPSRAGMGSSAALSVAVVRALSDLADEIVDDADVEARAGLAEEIFHGRASGIDAAVASRGGVLRFVRGTEPRSVPCRRLPVVVALVEPRVPTRHMVERVRRHLESRPAEITSCFEQIGELVTSAEAALGRADLAELGRLMDENHRLLRAIDVSTGQLDEACEAAKRAGALGAKLTGAGGGGCVIALTPGRSDEVASALGNGAQWVKIATLGQE